MQQKLCSVCRNRLQFPSELNFDAEMSDFLSDQSWVHCHHDEPEKPGYVWKSSEEKPKEKCWCRKVNTIIRGQWASIYNILVEINFCPECGRKLGD